jgi:hypothetical protein
MDHTMIESILQQLSDTRVNFEKEGNMFAFILREMFVGIGNGHAAPNPHFCSST